MILAEAKKGYGLLFLGLGAGSKETTHNFPPAIEKIVREFAGPIAILLDCAVRNVPSDAALEKILVPTIAVDYSRFGAEVAVAIAKGCGAMITALNISAPPAENELLRRPNQLLRTGRALLEDIVAFGEREGVRVRSKAFVGPAKKAGVSSNSFRSPAGVNDARAFPQDCCDRSVKCPTGDVLFDVVAHRTAVIGNNRLNPGKPFLLFRWYGCESTRFRARLFVNARANASASWAPSASSVPLVSWAP